MKKIIFLIVSIVVVLGVFTYVFKTSASSNAEYETISFETYQKKLDDKESFAIYFHKTGCTACQELEPTLNKFIKENKIQLFAIELSKYKDQYKDFLVENDIKTVPTIIRYSDGKEGKRLGNEVITESKLSKLLK